ncbi:ornithine cyclodeaminase [Planctomycetes bacterium Pan216]|uniref:Ornithine cyclodeaminase n=1 Tax=Kolteria novifilia TaxID=2527975 RepID=A0A518BD42_9BACT|nr:ornithine cyclodeaminase [Planctomycetes bacterium Pan216]
MLVLDAPSLAAALPMDKAIAATMHGFRSNFGENAFDSDEIGHDLVDFRAKQEQFRALGLRLVTLATQNPAGEPPLVRALVVAVDRSSNEIVATLDGPSLTAIAAGARSGLATDLLAEATSSVVALLGPRDISLAQLAAITSVRAISHVSIHGSSPSESNATLAAAKAMANAAYEVRIASTPAEAVADADIVCVATTSSTPLFCDDELKPGVHINAFGSRTPTRREVPSETVCKSIVTVDTRPGAMVEAGDLLIPMEEGLIGHDHIHADLADLLHGRVVGRTSPGQTTLFKSVGVSAQDLMIAELALTRARSLHLGHRLDFDDIHHR